MQNCRKHGDSNLRKCFAVRALNNVPQYVKAVYNLISIFKNRKMITLGSFRIKWLLIAIKNNIHSQKLHAQLLSIHTTTAFLLLTATGSALKHIHVRTHHPFAYLFKPWTDASGTGVSARRHPELTWLTSGSHPTTVPSSSRSLAATSCTARSAS